MIATYGDLVGAAGVDIHTGLLRVMRRGFVDHKQAQNTVGVYYDLLAALRSHTWWLIDPARARGEELARAMHRKPDDSDLDPARTAIRVCDGGAAFWGAVFDPETGQFSQVETNGPA